MKKQFILSALLIAQTILVLLFTFLAFRNEGIHLFEVFLNNVLEFRWNAQFNIDFSAYLVLSGLWIMWRNKFSVPSILFGSAASIIGFILFGPYLMYLLWKEEGDLRRVLVG